MTAQPGPARSIAILNRPNQALTAAEQAYQQASLALEQARSRLDWQRKQAAGFDGQIKQAEDELTRLADE